MHNSPRTQRGFTIVELIIVIVVIAILAAVTLVAYNGVISQARQSAAKSALQQAVALVENQKTLNDGKLPRDIRDADGGKGLGGEGSDLLYIGIGDRYCIAARASVTDVYHVTDKKSTPQSGGCEKELTVSTVTTQGSPLDIAVTKDGTVYGVSQRNVFKVLGNGSVQVIAGANAVGNTDGTGAAALFGDGANGIMVRSDGNLLVADEYNKSVRQVTPSGVVTTLKDNTGANAYFERPTDVDEDTEGNLFVAAPYGGVYKRSTSGVVSDAFGTGLTTGIAIDQRTNARYTISPWIHAAGYNVLWRTPSSATAMGQATLVAGLDVANTTGETDGKGREVLFNAPNHIAIDGSGNVYLADTNNRKVRVSTPSGAVYTLFGDKSIDADVDGPAETARIRIPYGIDVQENGTIYVSSRWGATRKVTFQ